MVGTIGGAVFMALLTAIRSVRQVGDAWRSRIFGGIISAMVLFQTLRRRAG